MVPGYHDGPIPAVCGNGNQFAAFVDDLRGNNEIHLIVGGELAHRFRIALVHAQLNVGVALRKLLQNRRQNKLGLGMRCCDGQTATIVIAEVSCRLADVFDVVQEIGDVFKNGVTSGRDRCQLFSGTFENLDVEFIFQQLDLVADTRLRGVQLFRSGRHVEVVTHDCVEKSKLL